MATLIAGLIIFLGIHSIRIFVPGFRDAKLAAWGEAGWKGFYAVLSLVGFVLIVWGYGDARPDAAILFVPPMWLRHVVLLLMVFAMIALMVYALPAGKLKPMLKHPMLLAVKIWAIAHLLANGDLASILLFGAFLIWAGWNRAAVKRRGAPLPEPGPVRNDLIAIVCGLVIWVLFVWKLHFWLIGVQPTIAYSVVGR